MVNHYIATSKNEVLELLAKEKLEIIAGGTDLMVQRRNWANTPPKFEGTVNILLVADLHFIKKEKNELHIGSVTSLAAILEHPDTPDLLKKAIIDIAAPGLRNVATIAGNIGNASPAGDTLPILYLYDALLVLETNKSKRTVPIDEVIVGPRKTTIKQHELITKIILPLHKFTDTTFVKVGGRKADAISKLSFTGAFLKEDNIIKDIRIVFGAVAPTMVRVKEIEESIKGKSTSDIVDSLDQLVDAYQEYIKPIDDQRSNKEYRTHVSLQLLMDFLLNL